MSRFFQWLNLVGVVIVAVLCCVQWSLNQRENDAIAKLDQTRRGQAATISGQSQQLKDDAAELTDVRERLDISESARHADEARLTSLQAEWDRLVAASEQLKKSLSAWMSACAARDVAIKQANGTIASLSARYVDAVSKYNDLVNKYNHLVNPSQAVAQTKP
jgi:chromosome segregation ATPase